MPFPRPFALVQSEDQWRRAAHQGTALVGDVEQAGVTRDRAVGRDGGGEDRKQRRPRRRRACGECGCGHGCVWLVL